MRKPSGEVYLIANAENGLLSLVVTTGAAGINSLFLPMQLRYSFEPLRGIQERAKQYENEFSTRDVRG